MNALGMVALSAVVLWLGYRFYGRFIAGRLFGAGDFPDAACPSRAQEDGVDFVPTRRSVLLGHHYVTIAGAGPIVGPAVAVTWGWLPALVWVVLGSIFIGAVHDLGSLVASVRNRGRTIGDLAADIMTPRVRVLFLAFIALALWVVLAVFAFVIGALFTAVPGSVLAVWIEIPLAVMVGVLVTRRGGSMLLWSLLALVLMYVAIGVGTLDAVAGLFTFADTTTGILFWLVVLFVYSFVASVLPVTQLLQPRDYINSHQLFLALGLVALGLLCGPFLRPASLVIVAPAINDGVPADASAIYPFLFITVACGAISGFHCMVASGTTARQLASEKDARAVGFGSMILEGGLAVIVIVCCVSGAGFPDTAAWNGQYSATWVDNASLLSKLRGFIDGGAGYMHNVLPFTGLALLKAVVTVVIISFAATTMDSATRIQRYVVTELGEALGTRRVSGKYTATTIAVTSAAALALFAGSGGRGGLVLWPVFGVMNQLLACLTFLVLNTWLAKRGKPVIYTLIPLLFLVVTVTWASIGLLGDFAAQGQWHLIAILAVGLVLEAWMLVEGAAALLLSRRIRADLAHARIGAAEAARALAGPRGSVIDADGVIRKS